MAKPSAADMEVALRIMNILDAVEDGNFPCGPDGQRDAEDPEFFDEDDKSHLRALYDRLMDAMEESPVALFRVVGGMCLCVMYEKNRIVDPDSLSLELHPRIVRALRIVEERENAHSAAGRVLFGIHEPKPARGFPPGRVRWILRNDSWVKAAVRTKEGLRLFPVVDGGDCWMPLMDCELAANLRAMPSPVEGGGE